MEVYDEEQEKNVNVYNLIEEFYTEHPECDDMFPRSDVERFMRKQAWSGTSQQEMKDMFPVLKLTALYLHMQGLEDGIEQLNLYDYQYLLWMASRGRFGGDVYLLTEENVKYFVEIMRKFSDFITDGATPRESKIPYMIDAFSRSVYLRDKFDYPDINENDEYFDLILRVEDLSEEETELINLQGDALMRKVSAYFEDEKFVAERGRSMFLFSDPEMIEVDKVEEDFWLSYWDYFLFDYHLLTNDMTPIEYYYHKEKDNLSTGDKMILRDLMGAKFEVFEIIDWYEDGIVQCRNLISDEEFEMPAPTIFADDFKQLVMFGHAHQNGGMMLNCITQFPASDKLRKRIKDELRYHYDMYKCQRPNAAIPEFLERHSAVVRHIVTILATRAQLGITPVRQLPEPVKHRSRNFISHDDKKTYFGILSQHAISKFGRNVVWDLFCDAAAAGSFGDWLPNSSVVCCAVEMLYIRINNMFYLSEDELLKYYQVQMDDVQLVIDWITNDLQLTEGDPRYLTEEGYVLSLYSDIK